MISIKTLINNCKKYYNYNNIYDNIIVEHNLLNKSELLDNIKYEINNSKFSNCNKIIKYTNNCNDIISISKLNCNIKILIYYNKKTNISYEKIFKNYNRLLIISNIYNINKDICFHLVLTNSKRIMPKNNYFETKNFNGGFTYIYHNNNIQKADIYIFRYDEYFKVMLHELIHHIGIINDSMLKLPNEIIVDLKKYFNISNDSNIQVNEGNVEFWATIYNLIFISIEYNIEFKKLYKKELEFSINQYFKLRCINKYKIWKENTNIFSYFIIKLILLYNYKEFINLKLPYDNKIFCNFIKNKYNNDFITKIKKIKNNKLNLKNKNSLDAMIFSSF